MPVFNNVLAGAAGSGGAADFKIERSLRFDETATAHLNRTPTTDGDKQKWTWSGWVKRSRSGNRDGLFEAEANGNYTLLRIRDDNDRISLDQYGGDNFYVYTNGVFRDPSAWYHIVCAVDTTQTTDSNKVKIYVNGVQQTLTAGTNWPSVNQNTRFNDSSYAMRVGGVNGGTQFDGLMAEVHFVDGQALAPSNFGESNADTGVWDPKKYSGTHGTNGFHFDFSDNSSRGALGDNRLSPDYSKLGGSTTTTTGAGTFYYGHDSNRLFDGSTANQLFGGWVNTGDDSNVIWSPPSGSYSVSTSLRVYAGYYSTVSVNGVSKATSNGNNAAAWVTLAHTGAITEIKVENTTNDNVARIGAIEIDGTVLVTNAWTVNNFQATSFDGVAASSHVGPGNLTNLAPGTYYNMFAVDSNNVSSDPGNGALVRFNFSQLGLSAPATITFDSYEQGGGGWTTVSTNIYTDAGTVTASTTSSGNTRSNTVNIPSGATYFELPGSYNSSHSLYSNGIHNLVWGGTRYSHLGPEEIDSLIDSPSNYEADSGNNGGNYCTWNPLTKSRGTMSNGNLLFYGDGTNTPRVNGTISQTSGKWYYEAYVLKPGPGTGSGDVHNSIGWGLDTVVQIETAPNTSDMNHSFYFMDSGWYKNFSGSNTNSNNGKWAPGDVIGVAADLDNNTLTFYRNGTQVLSQTIGVTAGTSLCPAHQSNTGNYGRLATNFGQRPFKYPPGGTGGPAATFKSLCTQNLDDPSLQPDEAFEVRLYTGDSNTSQNIDGYKFSPDLVWQKIYSQAGDHALTDTVRGVNSGYLQTEDTAAQTGNANDGVSAFLSDGWTAHNGFNNNGLNWVSYAWDAGEVTNPVGDIWQHTATKYLGIKFASASGGTVSFGQTTGSTTVEIWTSSDNSNWTQQGGTLTLSSGHTFTTSDQYVAIRNTSNATFENWYIAATDGATGHYSSVTYPSGSSWSGPTYTDNTFGRPGGVVNTDGSHPVIVKASPTKGFSIVQWENPSGDITIGHGLNKAPTVIFTKGLGSYEWMCYHYNMGAGKRWALNNTTNYTGTSVWNSQHPTSSTFHFRDSTEMDWVAYCWTPTENVFASGEYEGGSSPFVYCGFRPAFVMLKNFDVNGEEMVMYDVKRDPTNIAYQTLYTNSASGNYDGSTNYYPRNIDILSNGFRANTGNPVNQGGTHIWMAWAEHPLKYARAR